MGVDYYNILKVNRNASDDDLKKAYKRLAMIWHPTRTRLLRGLKPRLNSSRFLKLMMYSATLRSGRSTIIWYYFKSNTHYFGNGAEAKKAAPIENALPCSLEDLYKGAKKKMRISRIVYDASGKFQTLEEILTIDIKPGWKKGTKITFPEKGNQEPGIIPADLIFVVDEKLHPIYKRDGNDLVVNEEITLLEALTGKTLEFTTLDGRNLMIPLTDIVKPGAEVLVPNEGMPISREPGKKGNLRIKIDVRYPSRLTSEQKSELRRVLGGVLQ
ncbi:hypothetical protein GH714_040841 [Hevea brasiliensis]|uniref:J domain-containing protein n=1 Tax=Hevea brasiliensis TaxID=3981 RepID=A0A6A6MUS9_HEVBR|nr:hypothetical protein GH714_040841 [Hevea brasiliensis]